MIEKKKMTLKRACILGLLTYFFLAAVFYILFGNQLKYRDSDVKIQMTESNAPVGEILKGDIIKQTFLMENDAIDEFSLQFATYDRQNTGTIKVQLINEKNGLVVLEKILDVANLKDNSEVAFRSDRPIGNLSGSVLSLNITSETGVPGNAVTLWYNDHAERIDQVLTINNKVMNGTLWFSVSEKREVPFFRDYIIFISSLGILLGIYGVNLIVKQKRGKRSLGLSVINSFSKYGFLLRQLISRDFKTKYKRSVLGVLWSFVNPVLTMIVQYFVFSTIFNSEIENFLVYLLSGIVFFNFFSEATNMGLMSIVGNSSLITKVYIPKYIFPVSRVMSSTINLIISMVPLLLVVIITRVQITSAFLLLPFSIICIVLFCIGISLILSSVMVFFRDVQFLWNVLSMLWMYCTPIFYPISIIPEKLLVIFKMNPMYHFISFTRTVLMEGVSPEPKAYLFCAIAAVVPLVIGLLVFKKTQDKFVLHI